MNFKDNPNILSYQDSQYHWCIICNNPPIDFDTLNNIDKLKALDQSCIYFILQELLKRQKTPKLSIELIKPTLTLPTDKMVNKEKSIIKRHKKFV